MGSGADAEWTGVSWTAVSSATRSRTKPVMPDKAQKVEGGGWDDEKKKKSGGATKNRTTGTEMPFEGAAVSSFPNRIRARLARA